MQILKNWRRKQKSKGIAWSRFNNRSTPHVQSKDRSNANLQAAN
jgi:hypothetical protein